MEPLLASGGQLRLLTALRAFRLLRVVRLARHSVKEMWLLLKGLAMSFKTLASAITVFVFVNYLFGILAVALIGDSPDYREVPGDSPDFQAVQQFFQGLDQ